MNEQEAWWSGSFGDSYTDRNRVNWLQRVPFWTGILYLTGAGSVLEMGCNVGWNLLAIRLINPRTWVAGWDVNHKAVMQGKNMGLQLFGAYEFESYRKAHNPNYDLVFTAGCLIHVSSKEIEKAMQYIVDSSKKYILAIEYAADEEQEIEYRGHQNKLWKRPYGKMYEDMGLKLIEAGELPKDSGFDDCTYWLLEK